MNRAPPNPLASTTDWPHQMNHGRSREPWTDAWPRLIAWAILPVLAWTAVGLFQTVPETLRGFHWPEFVGKLIDAWAWALLTPAILLIDRRLTSVQHNVVRFSAIQLLLSVPFSVVHVYLAGLLQYPIAPIWWNPLRSTEFAIYYFLGGWLTY